MDTSEKGLALIKSFEGCYLEAYLCPAKVWTIGYGHTDDVEKGMVTTKEQAEKWLIKDVTWAEDVVERHVRVELSQHQFDALTSFVFNVGEGAFRSSTLLKELNKGRYETVPAQLLRWNKAGKPKKALKGLTRRRHAEAALWNELEPPPQPATVAPADVEPMPQAVCPSTPPMGALVQSRTLWGTGLGGIASIGTWVLGTASEASKQTAESLSATSALRDALGLSGGSLMLVIAVTCLGVAFFARLSDHFGGKHT